MFAYVPEQQKDIYKSAADFHQAKNKFLSKMDQKVTEMEATPLFKKFMNKLDPAKYGKEPEDMARDSRFLNDRMRQYFAEQNLYHAPQTVGSQNAQGKIIGEMMDRSDAKNAKRLAASMAPGAFLALGAGLGLTVAPVAGAIAAGVALVGFAKTALDWKKDEKEIQEMQKLMREAHKFQQGEGAESSEVERLKNSHKNTLQLLKRMGASEQKISDTLEKQQTEMAELMDGTKFKNDNTPAWQKRQMAKTSHPQKPS